MNIRDRCYPVATSVPAVLLGIVALFMCAGCGSSESEKKKKDPDQLPKKSVEKKDPDQPPKKSVPVLTASDTITVEVNKVLDGSDLGEGIDIACSEDGQFLGVSGGFQLDGGTSKFRLIDVAKKKEISTFNDTSFYQPSLVLAKDASWVATSHIGSLGVLELPSGKVLRRLRGQMASSLTLSGDNKLLVSVVSFGLNKGGLAGWNPGKEDPIFSEQLGSEPIACALLPNALQIAAWHVDGAVHIWDVKSWKPVASMRMDKLQHYRVSRLVSSSDGNYLAAGGNHQKIRIFSRKAGWKHRELESTCALDNMMFIPGGRLLAYRKSDASSGDIALADAETGEDMAILQGHQKDLPKNATNVIWGMTATADGSKLFTVCGRGEIKIWDLKKLR
jgi:WD40 repeat protein